MADVHAYFQVASAVSDLWFSTPLQCTTHTCTRTLVQRFIDQVILTIEGQWHQALVSQLESALVETASKLSPEEQELMIQEDLAIRAKREQTKQKIEQLERIWARLLEYEREALPPSDWEDEDEDEEEAPESEIPSSRSPTPEFAEPRSVPQFAEICAAPAEVRPETPPRLMACSGPVYAFSPARAW